MFDRWLQSEDERLAQESGLIRPLSLGDSPATALTGDAETAAMLYHLRREVDDAILIEENRSKRMTAEKRSHLAPSDAMKQKIRGMPPTPQRTYTLDTDYSGNFSGFNQVQMDRSSSPARLDSSTPSPPTSPLASPCLDRSYFGPIDWAEYPTSKSIPQGLRHRSSISTARSSLSNPLSSQHSVSGFGTSTAGSTPENTISLPLRHKISVTSLVTMALGDSALEWSSLCRKVQVERQSSEHVHGRERIITETKECDVHWRYREDTGISLRALYRSSKDGKPRPWTMQHFPATGPSIPLTTTYTDGEVSVDFPQGSFGKLDKNRTDIKYTFSGHDSAEKFQTLLYTNNGTNTAKLKYDRPMLCISSNKNPTECRGKNLRLWLRTETHLEKDVPVTVDVLVLLFYTSSLEEKGHWVEEPHYAFEWLTDSIYNKDSDKLRLVFSKEPARWAPDKVFRRRQSSKSSISNEESQFSLSSRKRMDSMEILALSRIGTGVSTAKSEISSKSMHLDGRTSRPSMSRTANLNRFGYSELEIKFQSKKDRKAFLDVWKEYVKPLGAFASGP